MAEGQPDAGRNYAGFVESLENKQPEVSNERNSHMRIVSLLALSAVCSWGQGNVIPLLECTDKVEVSALSSDRTGLVRMNLVIGTFGYFNYLPEPISLTPGSGSNFFERWRPERGQPGTFSPGYFPMVFQVWETTRDQGWILDGLVTRMRDGASRVCSALPTVPFLVPRPVRLVAGTTTLSMELMSAIWVPQSLRDAPPITVTAQVREVSQRFINSVGELVAPTTNATISNVRLTETALLGDVTIVSNPNRTNYLLSVQLFQNGNMVATKSMALEVYSSCGLSIAPSALPAATVNNPYAAVTLGATGGTSPYSFELAAGNLPPGITLANGTLSGTATAAGTYAFSLNAISSDRCLATQSYTLFVAGPACAQDVTTSASLTLGGLRQNLASGRWQQTVTMVNTSGAPIQGPVYLALQGLSANATLFNTSGSTQCAGPVGRPYLRLNAPNGTWLPGQALTAALEFNNNTPSQAITYTPRVLAGGSTL
jgi:hypothetical protein